MFYLTYRPKTINDLDNSRVKDTIANILSSKQLPHAFLFVGQKGTGKTSTARIVAKAVNCLDNAFAEKGTSYEPCNKCSNCAAIETGSSPDVMEQDAASNRGIDEIRSLIKEAAFAPMISRYRVFIIDEAHMITNDAFNALLKTLEEPPKSVMFILATTNEEKVPKTIISRCHVVSFGRAKKEDVISMLERITKDQKIEVNKEILQLIATHSEKSFRDATKLLEELIVQKKLTIDEARQYLGVRSKVGLLEILQNKPVKDALSWVEEFVQAGGSTRNIIEDLLDELRQILLAKSGVKTIEDTYTFTLPEVMFLMKVLSEAYNTVKMSPIESLPLEIAIVEFYNRKKA